MTHDEAALLLPRYIKGMLPQEDMLDVSRALVEEPALLHEMRLALALSETLASAREDAPPLPREINAPTRPGFLPESLTRCLSALRQTYEVTRSAIQLALEQNI